ncbi:MAG TPA: hypothetical protein PK720_00580 [bacterium]|jgi:hypothetical protein|nr:hypothetical protein [bacterium]
MDKKNSTTLINDFLVIEKKLQSLNINYIKTENTISALKKGAGLAKKEKVGLLLSKLENGQIIGNVSGMKDNLFEGEPIPAINEYIKQCRLLKSAALGNAFNYNKRF